MRLLLCCAVIQYLMALLAPSPWWAPDLVTVGLVLGVLAATRKWLALSLWAGVFHALPAVRHAGAFFIADLAIGGLASIAPALWDVTPSRLQRALVGLFSIALMAVACWLDGLWSAALAGLMLFRMGLTLLSVGVVQRVMLVRARA